MPQTALHRARREREPEAGERDQRLVADRRRSPPAIDAEGPASVGASIASVTATESDLAPALLARGSYSPLSPEAEGEAPELPRVEPEWRDAARSLVRHVQLGLSRRWRPGSRGRRFDLRRTLRASLQTGGEALAPRWLRRPTRAPRFVLLIDGSRSMSAHARTALQLAVALTSVTTRIDVFTFSTALQQVTRRDPSARRRDRHAVSRAPSRRGPGAPTSARACGISCAASLTASSDRTPWRWS